MLGHEESLFWAWNGNEGTAVSVTLGFEKRRYKFWRHGQGRLETKTSVADKVD